MKISFNYYQPKNVEFPNTPAEIPWHVLSVLQVEKLILTVPIKINAKLKISITKSKCKKLLILIILAGKLINFIYNTM